MPMGKRIRRQTHHSPKMGALKCDIENEKSTSNTVTRIECENCSKMFAAAVAHHSHRDRVFRLFAPTLLTAHIFFALYWNSIHLLAVHACAITTGQMPVNRVRACVRAHDHQEHSQRYLQSLQMISIRHILLLLIYRLARISYWMQSRSDTKCALHAANRKRIHIEQLNTSSRLRRSK